MGIDVQPQITSRASLLKEAGEALYGRSWKTEMAEALNISHRYVQFMASGKRKIPDWVESRLSELIEARLSVLADLLASRGQKA